MHLARPGFDVREALMSIIVQDHQATHDDRYQERGTSIVITFGGFEYYLDRAPAHEPTVQPCRPSDKPFWALKEDLLPCTVIDWSKDQLSKEDLDATRANLSLHDDVWTPTFLEGKPSCCHEFIIRHR